MFSIRVEFLEGRKQPHICLMLLQEFREFLPAVVVIYNDNSIQR